MLELQGAALRSLPIIDLEWIKDLINFDGPLLSLFRHRRHKDNYLYYWCDTDGEVNRWMILRISETNLLRLVNRLVPLDQIIPHGCQDDFVYFADLDGNGSPSRVHLLAIDAVPVLYTPEQGAFLNTADVEGMETYSVIIERNLSIVSVRELFKEFSNAYAFVYNLIKLRSRQILGHPWRGGFSAVHFFRELLTFVPIEDYPSLEAMTYASPGFIRFKLDAKTAGMVGNIIASYLAGSEGVDEAFNNLAALIRTNNLNDDEILQSDIRWTQHNPELNRLTRELLGQLQISSIEEFMAAARRPFEAAKMAMSFTRRIRLLTELELNRVVHFPNTFAPSVTPLPEQHPS